MSEYKAKVVRLSVYGKDKGVLTIDSDKVVFVPTSERASARAISIRISEIKDVTTSMFSTPQAVVTMFGFGMAGNKGKHAVFTIDVMDAHGIMEHMTFLVIDGWTWGKREEVLRKIVETLYNGRVSQKAGAS